MTEQDLVKQYEGLGTAMLKMALHARHLRKWIEKAEEYIHFG